MWQLNFIMPFAVAFIGLVHLTLFLVNHLCDAIVDGTAKKASEKISAEVLREEDVVGTSTANKVLPKALTELSAVEQKVLQCASELAQ